MLARDLRNGVGIDRIYTLTSPVMDRIKTKANMDNLFDHETFSKDSKVNYSVFVSNVVQLIVTQSGL